MQMSGDVVATAYHHISAALGIDHVQILDKSQKSEIPVSCNDLQMLAVVFET